ncbi:MAG: hypothetical protein RLZ86_751, partial [Actinomycetota bacterium]
IHGTYPFEIEATAVPLVGDAGIDTAIAHDVSASRQVRFENFGVVLSSITGDEERLGHRTQVRVGRVVENVTDSSADLRATGLACEHGTDVGGQSRCLRGLATTLDPFEGDVVGVDRHDVFFAAAFLGAAFLAGVFLAAVFFAVAFFGAAFFAAPFFFDFGVMPFSAITSRRMASSS